MKKKNVKGVSKMKAKENLNMQFMREVAKLEFTEFLGVARILKVNLVDEDKKPREFVDVFEELVKKYSESSRSRRRELLGIIKAITRGKK